MKYLLKNCPPNPTYEYAESIIIPAEVGEIVSQGGGSTIDVGKWLAFKFKKRHTAVPTTAGTGSEVTRYCVLTVAGKKKTFELDKPDSYILDPKLVVSLPPLHTLASGLDALAQGAESFWSVNATTESKAFAATAIAMVMDNLKTCLDNPKDEIARMNMLIAANFSGRAIEITKTNVGHAISYPLTDIYGIPHGIACAMSLRYFGEKFGMAGISDFLLGFAIPRYEFDKEKVADIAIQSEKLKDCPFEVTREDIVNSLS